MTSTSSIGVMLPRDLPAHQVLNFARTAENVGFDELWVVEDLGFRGGFSQAAAVLASTERIGVGIGILPAASRNLAFAAMEIATLGQLFPRRVEVGIGHGMPGWMRQAGCWPERPLTFLSQYTEGVRALLAGGVLDGMVAGTRLEDVRLAPSSLPQVVPPLLLGVRGPRSLAASGQVADGTVLAEPVTPEYVVAAREQIAAQGAHRVVAYNLAAVHQDPNVAIATARPGLEWIGEPDWAPHLEPLPFAAEFAALRADCATRQEFVERLPSHWVQQLALAGTPDQVRARIDDLAAAGVTSNVLIPAGPDALAALKQLSTVL
ncbi:LLM class flavin-dependent oxidoreductase [Promicromonospora soli]|uniref:N5,N10-methylene tetrahydromethanopterin reductase n=1 Tax=Promicromonospora soli TaxID=2035533 RepID=A0A919KVV8_9MICO|nr:LLM class flavin-dependent oxidoreductase [Promicromonospora soli]GHH75250.1 N5,N10-methylene tetrahydromethanopterin reductase [Promicromonospora soli]